MKIFCKEHYDNVVKFAESIKDSTLRESIEKLQNWEENSQQPCVIEMYWDHAPHSFLFKQHYENGTYGIIGGLVYHGNPDESGCFQDDHFLGWRIHT